MSDQELLTVQICARLLSGDNPSLALRDRNPWISRQSRNRAPWPCGSRVVFLDELEPWIGPETAAWPRCDGAS